MHDRFFTREVLIKLAPEIVDTMDVQVETGLKQLIKDIERNSVTFKGQSFPKDLPLTRKNIVIFLRDLGFGGEDTFNIIEYYSQKPTYALTIGSTILQPFVDAGLLEMPEGLDAQERSVRNTSDDFSNDIDVHPSEGTLFIKTTAHGYGVQNQNNQRIATIGAKESKDKLVAISLILDEGFYFAAYELTGVFKQAMDNYLAAKRKASIPTYHLFKKLANLPTNTPLQDINKKDLNEIFFLIDQILVELTASGEQLDINLLPEKSKLAFNRITLLGRLNELKNLVDQDSILLEKINSLSALAQEKYDANNKKILKFDYVTEYKNLFAKFLNTPITREDDANSINILKQISLLTLHYESLSDPVTKEELIVRMLDIIKVNQLETINDVLFMDMKYINDIRTKNDLIFYQGLLIEVIKKSISSTLSSEFNSAAAHAALILIEILDKEKKLSAPDKNQILFTLLKSVITKDTNEFFAFKLPGIPSDDFITHWELYKDEFRKANIERILEENNQKVLGEEPNYIQGVVNKLSSLDLVMLPHEQTFLKKIIDKTFKAGEKITAEKFLQALVAYEKAELKHNLSKKTIDNFVELLNCMEQIDALFPIIQNLATAGGYDFTLSEVKRVIFQSTLKSFADIDNVELETLESKVYFTYKFVEKIFGDNFNFITWMTILSGINENVITDTKGMKLDVIPLNYDKNTGAGVRIYPAIASLFEKNNHTEINLKPPVFNKDIIIERDEVDEDYDSEEDERKTKEELINSIINGEGEAPFRELNVFPPQDDHTPIVETEGPKIEGLRRLVIDEYGYSSEEEVGVEEANKKPQENTDKKIAYVSDALSQRKYIPNAQFEMSKGQKYSDISLLQSVNALKLECARFKARMLKNIQNSLPDDLKTEYFEGLLLYTDKSGYTHPMIPELIFAKILEDYKKDNNAFPKSSYFYSFIENYVNAHKLHVCLKEGLNHPYKTLYNFEVQFNALRADFAKHSNAGNFVSNVSALQREDIILQVASDQYQADLTWEIRKAVGKQEIENIRKHKGTTVLPKKDRVYPKYGEQICWPDGVQTEKELAKLSPKAREKREKKIEPIVTKAIKGMIAELKNVDAHRKDKTVPIRTGQSVLAANVSDNYELKVLLDKYDALSELKKTLNPSDPESAAKFKAEFKKHEKTFNKSKDTATDKFFKVIFTVISWGLAYKETWKTSSDAFSRRVGHFFSHKKKRDTQEEKEHRSLVEATFPKKPGKK